MIYFGGLIGKIFEDVNGLVQHALRPLFYNICTLLYKVIIYLYETFEKLCTTRLLSLGVIEELSKRLGLILGIVMLFIVIFSFINNLIDPDTIKDKKKGPMNILKKILVVLVALGFSNFGFNKIYEVQKIVVESHILNKLLLPATISDPENFGGLIAARTFTAFYTIDEDVLTGFENIKGINNQKQVETCTDYISIMQRRIYKYKNFELGNECLNEAVTLELVDVYGDKTKEDRFIIDFSYILCLVTACFLIYFLFSYCISVGVRIFQLAFLEIVSPIAIIGYLQPKDDNMLSKWGKIYISTYIDVFIRITVINFAVFLIAIILDNNGSEYSSLWTDLGDPTGFDKTFIMMILIFALLTFAKKAPDLIKEIFPTGAAKLGLGGFHMKDALGLSKGLGVAAGIGAGAAVGLIGGGLGGMIGGAFRGGKAGFGAKNVLSAFGAGGKAQADNLNKLRALRNAGGTRFGRFAANVNNALGRETAAERMDTNITRIERQIDDEKNRTANHRRTSKNYGAVRDIKKKMEDRAESKLLKGTFDQNDVRYAMQKSVLEAQAKVERIRQNGGTEQEIADATMEYNRTLDQMKKEYITASYANSNLDAAMTGMAEDISSTITNNLGDFNGIDTNITNFESLNRFDIDVTNRSNDIGREISASDIRLQNLQDQILDIKSSEAYRSAQANKNNMKN